MAKSERGERQAETVAVRAYLTALTEPKPRRSRDVLTRRRAEIEKELAASNTSPIDRLRLMQGRIDIDTDLERHDGAARLDELEATFTKLAPAWCERMGVSAAALREVGVPTDVLRRAGLR